MLPRNNITQLFPASTTQTEGTTELNANQASEATKPEKMRWGTFEWLQRETLAETPRQILNILAKLEFLRSNGLAEWNTTMRHLSPSPNSRRFLAGVARRMSIQALAAQPEIERYPFLACFTHWCLTELTDRVLDLFDSYLGHAYARARRDKDVALVIGLLRLKLLNLDDNTFLTKHSTR